MSDCVARSAGLVAASYRAEHDRAVRADNPLTDHSAFRDRGGHETGLALTSVSEHHAAVRPLDPFADHTARNRFRERMRFQARIEPPRGGWVWHCGQQGWGNGGGEE